MKPRIGSLVKLMASDEFYGPEELDTLGIVVDIRKEKYGDHLEEEVVVQWSDGLIGYFAICDRDLEVIQK